MGVGFEAHGRGAVREQALQADRQAVQSLALGMQIRRGHAEKHLLQGRGRFISAPWTTGNRTQHKRAFIQAENSMAEEVIRARVDVH